MSVDLRPRRSAIYVPADKPRSLEKARSLDCDIVIIDLEDAVAPDRKLLARDTAVDALIAGGFGHREVMVRVNGLHTPWGNADLAAIAHARPDALLLPKISSASDLRASTDLLPAGMPVWVMIETCLSILNLASIAEQGKTCSLVGFVAGTNDLMSEMRCRPSVHREALMFALSSTITAARAYGLCVIDGVFNDIADDAGFRSQAEQGAGLGFDGKTLIHPCQVAAANAAFSPGADDVATARRIVTAFADPANSGKGVLDVDGAMAELLHLRAAHRTLAIAELVAARSSPPIAADGQGLTGP